MATRPQVARLTPARRRQVDALLEQVGGEVAALPEPVLRALMPVLAEAERELTRDLRAVLARMDGDATFTAQMLRRALVQVRAGLAKVDLEGGVRRTLEAGGQAAVRLAQRNLVAEFARFSSLFEGTVEMLPIAQAGLLAEGSRMLIPRFRASAARYGALPPAADVMRPAGMVWDDLRFQLSLGVVRGETVAQLTQRLVRLGGPRGRVALRGVAGDQAAHVEDISEGLFRRYRYFAERVVRTEVINAYNVEADAAIAEVAKARPDLNLMRRWNAAADRRVCIVCASLDGKVTGANEPFPDGTDAPPAHPNCRCAVVAWREGWG